MFGNPSEPAQLWSFAATTPIAGLAAAEEYLVAGHRLRNKLCEIERTRREEIDALVVSLCPALPRLRKAIADQEKVRDELYEKVKARRKQNRKREPADQETKDFLASVRDRLRDLYAEQKTLKTSTYESVEFKSGSVAIEAKSSAAQKEAYAACAANWGTKLDVFTRAKSMRSGAPPEFKKWNLSGRVTVQVQKQRGNECKFTDLLDGIDPRARLKITPGPRRDRYVLHLRLVERPEPVWLAVPVFLHRMPPSDAKVKWIYVSRYERPTGNRPGWQVMFSLTRTAGWEKHPLAEDGCCGIDLGWRRKPDGIRVAYLADDEGREEELLVPNEWSEVPGHYSETTSLLDQHFNDARLELVDWLRQTAHSEWLTKETEALIHWRSRVRFRKLILDWEISHRFAGDEKIMERLWDWRTRDKRSDQQAKKLLKRFANWLENYYRHFAKRVREKYGVVALEKMNLVKLVAKVDGAADKEELPTGQRRRSKNMNLGKLRQHLIETCRKIEWIDPKNTTRCCNACGNVETFDAASDLWHTCGWCGARWDQDANAAKNLRDAAASGVVVV